MIKSRAGRGAGCPYCAGHLVCETNSLASLFPEVAAEWHKKKNGKLTPSDVTGGSNKRVWWQCPVDKRHVWQAKILDRTRKNSGCPYCAGKLASRQYNLARKFPQVAAQWHPTKNGDLKPTDLPPYSMRRAWWLCKKGKDHVWQATVASRTHAGAGCPFCSGNRPTRERSLAGRYPHLIKEWHPSRNGQLSPYALTYGSHKATWWQCRVDSRHVWQAPVKSRTLKGTGCPFCAKRQAGSEKKAHRIGAIRKGRRRGRGAG